MKPLTLLRCLILTELILAVAYFISSSLLKDDLPILLKTYLTTVGETRNGLGDYWPLILGIGFVALNVISMVGLWFESKWANPAYLFAAPAVLTICLFLGPKVDHAIAYTIDIFSVFVMGLIVSQLLVQRSPSTGGCVSDTKNGV